MGAYDYINKPFEITDIRKTVKKAIDYLELKYNNEYFAQKTNPNYQKIDFIGNNAEIKNIHEVIKKIATKDVTVLIQGETGSGKEVVAKLIHKYSKRNNENFISVDCSAIPSTLIESELFGYEKGAFTGAVNKKIGRFELADNGTLFLDEIGNIPIEFQPKLLRAIQENEIFRLGGEKAIKINTRLIVATHVNLEESIYNQKFREDLYFRINVIRINLPPLRERLDDIPLLLDYFLEKCCKKFGINKLNYDNNVIAYLQSYNWPGNIREFQNAVERAIVLTGSLNKLQVKNFNLSNSSVNEANTFFKNFVNKKRTLKEAQQNFESNYISEILKKYNGSRKLASEHLKIDRSYMSKLITKYNIKI
jgi:DNA-binding NtrC family response regulator